MCRHASYIGSTVSLEEFLLLPDHSLVIQSYKPKEMMGAEVNVDGFGLGWYSSDGSLKRYISTKPIWADRNIHELASLLRSKLWVGNVRSATVPESITARDTPPYCVGNLVFSHNGYIRNFPSTVRPLIRKYLKPEIEAEVQGNTDSEYLFAVLRQLLPQHSGDIQQTIFALLALLRSWGGEECGLFNIIVSDGSAVFATRHALGGQCPSLYIGQGGNGLKDGWIVTSEPMCKEDRWEIVPEHSIVVMEQGDPPEVRSL